MKAHRFLCHSTLGSRVTTKKRRGRCDHFLVLILPLTCKFGQMNLSAVVPVRAKLSAQNSLGMESREARASTVRRDGQELEMRINGLMSEVPLKLPPLRTLELCLGVPRS